MEQIIMEQIGNWIGAILIIMVFTFLLPLKKQRLYRIAETIFVAAAVGHSFIISIDAIAKPASQLPKGDFLQLIPILLGIFMFTRYAKRLSWLARFPIALLVGTGTGVAVRAMAEAQITAQLAATILPLAQPGKFLSNFNNLCMVIMVPAAMLYFVFIRPAKTGGSSALSKIPTFALNKISTFGRIVVLVALGSLYGNLIMGRMSTLIGVIQFLISDWLRL